MKTALVAVVLSVLGLGFSAGAASAQSTSYRISTCPTLGQITADMSSDEIRCRCFGGPACDTTVSRPDQAAPVSCGQLRAMASRMSIGQPESLGAGLAADKYCQGGSDATVPTTASSALSNSLQGTYQIDRGYYHPNPPTCESHYVTSAYISNGQIEFTSGGHTWRGVIKDNSWVFIQRDGVYPRPRNPTAIIGPLDNAILYNGYCGEGYFRIRF